MDKWTPSLWLTATTLESHLGTEDITAPVAQKLLEHSGLLALKSTLSTRQGGYQDPSPDNRLNDELNVLDIGTGLGQVTSTLVDNIKNHESEAGNRVKIVAGDIAGSLLDHLNEGKAKNGWEMVDVECLDGNELSKPDDTFDFVFANFLFANLQDPLVGIKESIRVLKPGGTLSFSTWGAHGPFQVIQRAISLLPSYPLTDPLPSPGGEPWSHPRYLHKTLLEQGLEDIRIEPFEYVHTAHSPGEMTYKMKSIVPYVTFQWGDEREELGWKLFEIIEETLRREQGDGPVRLVSVAIVVSARKPE
ncbi:hypothetical protein I302_107885 [Kwoniella bestiolae CBS 10118]|uniref:Methyltransferase type 11 domain-containing protein n=1 Tax=Kwoniella bestiolae CBS 10118 TaxID=1296100 RepID=A0A1B9FX99_9TREE|nr:hypothetical protein I302_06373 [Kwoniella bestiolae CBS 10118]OCF23392.1 hypothetical protein I302_06373 [Kwoniella bestiolae CBS 10118]